MTEVECFDPLTSEWTEIISKKINKDEVSVVFVYS